MASVRNWLSTSFARADGESQADLARPLGHRHEHDVHDADATDQKRHARDAREERRHGLRLGRAGGDQVVLRLHAHRVVGVPGDVPPIAHLGLHGVGHDLDPVARLRREQDVIEPLAALQLLDAVVQGAKIWSS
jgi:hypothetical protein